MALELLACCKHETDLWWFMLVGEVLNIRQSVLLFDIQIHNMSTY